MNFGVINDMIGQAMLGLHTAFLGKVIGVSGDTAKVQPLTMTKVTGETAKKPAVLSAVPITKNARKFGTASVNVSNGGTVTVPSVTGPEPGDVVLCIVCDRGISQTKRGNFDLPEGGHHAVSDSVIAAIL